MPATAKPAHEIRRQLRDLEAYRPTFLTCRETGYVDADEVFVEIEELTALLHDREEFEEEAWLCNCAA